MQVEEQFSLRLAMPFFTEVAFEHDAIDVIAVGAVNRVKILLHGYRDWHAAHNRIMAYLPLGRKEPALRSVPIGFVARACLEDLSATSMR